MTIEQAVTAAVSAVGGIIVTLVGQWFTARSPLQSRNAELLASNAELNKRDAAMQVKIASLQAEVSGQQKYIDTHLSRKALLAKYTIDESTGSLVLDGHYFCSPCFHEDHDPPREIQMRKLPDGQYQCPKCDLPRRAFALPNRRA